MERDTIPMDWQAAEEGKSRGRLGNERILINGSSPW
jgi:hypothetical protein